MDVIGTSDPYVILELLPFSLYHKPPKAYRTATQKRTLNPEFNEVFHW
jgi:Ca2+-dependent lipid-binding protein